MKAIDLKTPYSRNSFISFFRDHFLPEDFNILDESISPDFQSKHFQAVSKIGEIPSLDLTIYEIKHHAESDPRVSLSRDSFRLLSQYGQQRALILFISEKTGNYRLSLVTIDLKWEEGKRVKKEYSNPRRYSFFLGPDSRTHTPEEYLLKPGRIKDFEDLKKRFSIEVVNKDFYTQIAILFTQLAGGKRAIGRQKFDEKGILVLPSTTDDTLRKEFAVRLIGRLVFCWFLKKKRSKAGISLLSEEILSSEAVNKAGLPVRSTQTGNSPINLSPNVLIVGTFGDKYYHNILEPLFFQVLNTPTAERKRIYQKEPWSQIPFLNGGLFTPHQHDFYVPGVMDISRHINTLKAPDRWFKELFELFETYNFTIDENTSMDVELSIDPEMLGRIFENLLAEINPETGETARKATGSYYTPRPVVDYMVDESLKQCLLTKTNLNEETISGLLAYEIEGVSLSDRQKEEVINALDTIKVLDPACGSGAFPMGILQKMLLILQKVDPDSKVWFTKQIAKLENPILRKEIETKLKSANVNYIHKLGIIQSAIYGVDIQSIAVDISKLRFFLSLIVDEKVNDDKGNRGIEPLPNLEFKFVCANSLIGLPKKEVQQTMFEATSDIDLLKNLRDSYLRSYGKEKASIEKIFRETQSRMFEHSLNWINHGGKDTQTLKLSQWDPFSFESCGWFDPEWMFGISHDSPLSKGDKGVGGCGGFDVVIGNPPYVQLQKDRGKLANLYKNCNYKTFERTGDIYTLFYENGINILKSDGYLCFITSNKWMRAAYGKSLRKFFNSQNPILLIDLGPGIFENATVDTNILIIQRENNKEQLYGISLNVTAKDAVLADFINENKSILPKLGEDAWFIGSNAEQKLKEKIERIGKPLKEWDVNIYRGVLTGLNEAFIIDNATKERICKEDPNSAEILKPILRGRDIKRYGYEWAGVWLIASGYDIDVPKNYPAIFSHLKQFEIKAKKRDDQGVNWWNLRACSYYSEFEKEKLVWKRIGSVLRFGFDDKYTFCQDSTCIMTGRHLKFLCACMNSKLCYQLLYDKAPKTGTGDVIVSVQALEPLLVPPITSSNNKIVKQIEDKVEEILKAKQHFPVSPIDRGEGDADTSALERQIDQMVYELYGLTPEEITIVEGKR